MKIVFLSFIFSGLVFCSSSKQGLKNTNEAYQLINKHFEDKSEISINRKTVKISSDISSLHNIKNWNEANYSIENAQRDYVNFAEIFNKEQLKIVTNRLQNTPEKILDKNQLSSNIVLSAHDRGNSEASKKSHSIGFPFLLKAKTGEEYGILYEEYVNGIENGYGAIYIYIRKGKQWKPFFVYSLWIS